MLDQFRPQFFALAFTFLFKACVACPDIERRPRYRRGAEAPQIRIHRWCEVMARRIEAQFRRDWCCSYTIRLGPFLER